MIPTVAASGKSHTSGSEVRKVTPRCHVARLAVWHVGGLAYPQQVEFTRKVSGDTYRIEQQCGTHISLTITYSPLRLGPSIMIKAKCKKTMPWFEM